MTAICRGIFSRGIPGSVLAMTGEVVDMLNLPFCGPLQEDRLLAIGADGDHFHGTAHKLADATEITPGVWG